LLGEQLPETPVSETPTPAPATASPEPVEPLPPLSVPVAAEPLVAVPEPAPEPTPEPVPEPGIEPVPEPALVEETISFYDTITTALRIQELNAQVQELTRSNAFLEEQHRRDTLPATTAPTPSTEPKDDPVTLYRRLDLTTAAGRKTACMLWVHGMTPQEIAACFHYSGPAAASCVTAAIIQFLAEEFAGAPWSIIDNSSKTLALNILGKDAPKLPEVPSSTEGDQPEKGHLQDRTLKTPEGRAAATAMWVEGASQSWIGGQFGYAANFGSGNALVNLAIRQFIEEDCGIPIGRAQGDARKRLARSALKRFREGQAATTTRSN
jgi:hypothetical protein